MALVIASLEGDTSGETANVVGSTTVDGSSGVALSSDFEIETGRPDNADAYKGAGVWGIAQRIYIEGQTEDQELTVSLVIDNTVIEVGTVSTAVGIKKVMEVPIQRAGWIFGVRVEAADLSKRIEISAIELDVYIPEG